MRLPAVLAGCAAATTVVVTGCSGSDDGPAPPSATVSVARFCAGVHRLDSVHTVAEAKKAFAALGTPERLPADAAAGYRALRRALVTVDGETEARDFGQVLLRAMGHADADDVERVRAFAQWVAGTCGLDGPSDPAAPAR